MYFKLFPIPETLYGLGPGTYISVLETFLIIMITFLEGLMFNVQTTLNSENWQESPNRAKFKRLCCAEFSAYVFSLIRVVFV